MTDNAAKKLVESLVDKKFKQEQFLLDPQKCLIAENHRFLELKLYLNMYIDVGIENDQIGEIGGKSYACKKGCAYCCHDRVDATIMDVFAAFEYFSFCNFLNDVSRKEIKDKISSYPRLFHEKAALNYGVYTLQYSDLLPCPFLINNTCSIYLARPSTCRSNHTYGSPESCKTPGAPTYGNRSIVEKAGSIVKADIEFQKGYSHESSFSNEPIPVRLDEKPFWGVLGVLSHIVWGMETLSIREARTRYLKLIKEYDIDNGELPGENIARKELAIQAIDNLNPAISQSEKKICRNEPCPCGSGKKYKKCCGRSQ